MRRMRRVKTEQLIHRHMQHFTNQVIQGHIDGGLGGGVEADEVFQASEDVFDRKGVIAEIARKFCNAGQHCLLVLTVILIGSSFTISYILAMSNLHNDVW